MFQMLWESPDFRQSSQIVKYGPHLQLFAAWCARRTSHLLTNTKSHAAIQTAERFATAATTRSAMHQARLAAETVVIQIAAAYEDLSPTAMITNPLEPTNLPSGINTRATLGAALLNAATAASTCCLAHQLFGALQAADLCAKYARQALYWEALTNGSDTVLITELLEAEDLRQAHTLRVFLGNPFNPIESPAMFLPTQLHPDQFQQSLS